LVRAKILVEGDVQRVGYRDFVQKVARRLGVKGYVENLDDGNVQIVCEADGLTLKRFVEGIKVREELIMVEKVTITVRSKASGEFDSFKIKRGEIGEELSEIFGPILNDFHNKSLINMDSRSRQECNRHFSSDNSAA
jgi:acylphosphatase